MDIKTEDEYQLPKKHLDRLTMPCPICGKEFACNKTYHVYTALVARKRQYFCSYSCYKRRERLKINCNSRLNKI